MGAGPICGAAGRNSALALAPCTEWRFGHAAASGRVGGGRCRWRAYAFWRAGTDDAAASAIERPPHLRRVRDSSVPPPPAVNKRLARLLAFHWHPGAVKRRVRAGGRSRGKLGAPCAASLWARAAPAAPACASGSLALDWQASGPPSACGGCHSPASHPQPPPTQGSDPPPPSLQAAAPMLRATAAGLLLLLTALLAAHASGGGSDGSEGRRWEPPSCPADCSWCSASPAGELAAGRRTRLTAASLPLGACPQESADCGGPRGHAATLSLAGLLAPQRWRPLLCGEPSRAQRSHWLAGVGGSLPAPARLRGGGGRRHTMLMPPALLAPPPTCFATPSRAR